jgi:hypothetical protein
MATSRTVRALSPFTSRLYVTPGWLITFTGLALRK